MIINKFLFAERTKSLARSNTSNYWMFCHLALTIYLHTQLFYMQPILLINYFLFNQLIMLLFQLHTTDVNDGLDWNRINLKSVTEENTLDEFLSTAEMAGTEFCAGRLESAKYSSLTSILTTCTYHHNNRTVAHRGRPIRILDIGNTGAYRNIGESVSPRHRCRCC